MTEGNGHVIDPNGDARRALHEAVAEHGPEVLSNAVIMDRVCRDHLSGLPGESILIGSAARSDVPALLRDLIPRLGNYGAIQSVAATLAEEHGLDIAGVCVGGARVRPGPGPDRVRPRREHAEPSGAPGAEPSAAGGSAASSGGPQVRGAASRGGPPPRGPSAAAGQPGWAVPGARRARDAGAAAWGAGGPGIRGLTTGGMPGSRGRAAGRRPEVAGVQPQHDRDRGGHRAGRRLPGGRGGGAPEPVSGQDGGGDLVPVPGTGTSRGHEHESQPGRVTGCVPRPEPDVGLPDPADQDPERGPGPEQLPPTPAPRSARPR